MRKFLVDFNGEIFKEAREKVNVKLLNLLSKMTQDEVDTGEITLKIKINLVDGADDFGQAVKTPYFKSEITSKIEKKSKTDDLVYGDWQLEFDKGMQGWTIQEVYRKNSQTELGQSFSEDEDYED